MEKESEYFFAYSASLRIIGDNLPFEEIESTLQISATHKRRKDGEKFIDDRWILESPLSENEKLDEHLEWLWSKIGSHKDYIVELKSKYHIDIFAGYRSDCWHCGTVISPKALKICYELDIKFELSIIVT